MTSRRLVPWFVSRLFASRSFDARHLALWWFTLRRRLRARLLSTSRTFLLGLFATLRRRIGPYGRLEFRPFCPLNRLRPRLFDFICFVVWLALRWPFSFRLDLRCRLECWLRCRIGPFAFCRDLRTIYSAGSSAILTRFGRSGWNRRVVSGRRRGLDTNRCSIA